MDHGWFFRSSVGRRLHGPVSQRLAVMNKAAANFRSESLRVHMSAFLSAKRLGAEWLGHAERVCQSS